MTPDQITAYFGGAAALVGTVTGAYYRAATKAGKALRRTRKAIEAADRYIYELRRAAIQAGVAPDALPRAPKALRAMSSYEDDEDDEDDS